MKLIKQKDTTGCGLACVAMITGQTYNQVKRKYLPAPRLEKLNILGEYYTDAKDLHNLSKNIAPKMISVKYWETIPNFAIVALGKRKDKSWHWVVFQRKNSIPVFYDPIYNKIRTDFGRVNLKAYVPIS
jgi:ABC-type bacteriocin/lantibiotic exporter with double-glycine peptidase domain